MTEITEVLNITRTTFDLYNKAINLFDNADYYESCNLFGQVIFNLYLIKKQLLNSNINTPEKTQIYKLDLPDSRLRESDVFLSDVFLNVAE